MIEARFSAHLSETSTLSVAPPAAFGFLGPVPAPINIFGSTLQVPEGQTLSLLGGDITVAPSRSTSPSLKAPGGRLYLVSVASAGEVVLHPADPTLAPEVASFPRLGQITLSGGTTGLRATGTSGGTVVLRGGRLMIDGATVASRTEGDMDGAETGIDIGVAGEVVITNGAVVGTNALGAGRAGAVRLMAGSLEVSNDAILGAVTSPGSTGRAGDISIEVGQLTLTGGGKIFSQVAGAGPGGTVTVTAHDMIHIVGQGSDGLPSSLSNGTGSAGSGGLLTIAAPTVSVDGGLISTGTSGAGQGGDIQIKVGQLSLTGGGAVTTDTFGPGQGGTVTITATNTIAIAGRNSMGVLSGVDSRGEGDGAAGHLSLAAPTISVDRGAIFARTTGAGQPGDVQVQAGRLSLTGGGGIGSPPFGPGRGGTVNITATDTIAIVGQDSAGRSSNILAATSSAGAAGRVVLTAPTISVDGGLISVSTIGVGEGRAGDIQVQAGRLTLTNGASITSGTTGLGQGGTVTITATDTLAMDRSTISAGSIGGGRAGDIRVQVGRLSLTGGAAIASSTLESGLGGTVTITATDTIAIAGQDSLRGPSEVSAKTDGAGAAGRVVLTAPTISVDGGQILARTTGAGQAGDVQVQAGRLSLTGGATIQSSRVVPQ